MYVPTRGDSTLAGALGCRLAILSGKEVVISVAAIKRGLAVR